MRLTLLLGWLLVGCTNKDAVSWDQQVKPLIEATCVHCHNPKTVDRLVERTCAATIPDGDLAFAAERFRSEYVAQASDKAAADALFAELCAGGAPRNVEKDRVLYGLKQLRNLLSTPPLPDYSSVEAFDAFATTREAMSYEGCEIITFLAKGEQGEVDGMPPLWATRLMEILSEPYSAATSEGRAVIRRYVESLLPYGAGSCGGGGYDPT